MPENRTLKIVAGIAGSFTGLLGMIIFLLEMKIISVEMAILMLVALLGMYLGSMRDMKSRMLSNTVVWESRNSLGSTFLVAVPT